MSLTVPDWAVQALAAIGFIGMATGFVVMILYALSDWLRQRKVK